MTRFDIAQVIYIYEESVDTYRKAISSNAENCDVGLSRALTTLSWLLALRGSRDDDPLECDQALQTALEAVALKRKLASANPIAFERELAGALRRLSSIQLLLDQPQQAAASAEESAEILRRWPVGSEPLLAKTLSELGDIQWQSGDITRAMTTAEEVVAISRELRQAAATEPESATRLGQALAALGYMESKCGETRQALEHSMEAVAVLRDLTAASISNHSIAFAAATLTLAEVRLAACAEPEISLDTLDEAIGNCLTAQLLDSSGESGLANMINSLNKIKVNVLDASGRHDEANQLRREIGGL